MWGWGGAVRGVWGAGRGVRWGAREVCDRVRAGCAAGP
ncbi:hypothetical protein STTU_5063 [Streptomyces sp. Tu6071]|nr:hypothetical protein STTU_5063 [Streptomyces sp. Tu6071]